MSNKRSLGLTAAVSKAMRAHVVKVLDLLLAEVKASFAGDPDGVERDLVDEVSRWAARQEERLFPSGRDDHGRVGLTPEQYRARVDEEFGQDREFGQDSQPIEHEPTNGNGQNWWAEEGMGQPFADIVRASMEKAGLSPSNGEPLCSCGDAECWCVRGTR